MQRYTVILTLLALIVGFILFKVKYEVVETEEKLRHTLAQIGREEDNIHVLRAEWSHLNEPQRLQYLAEKYLDIAPIKAEQVIAIVTDYSEKKNSITPAPRAHHASMKEAE